MALNKALIGKEYPPSVPYEVGREKIRDFAMAIGDTNPVYSSEDAAKAAGYPDIIAPPTFLTIMNFKYSPQVVGDPELGINYALVVHGEQEYEWKRPIVVGDVLKATPRIADIYVKGPNEFLVIEAEITDADGEVVCVSRGTLLSRGTAEGAGS